MKFITAFILSLLASATQAATPSIGLPIIWNSQRMHIGGQEFGDAQQFAGIILQINPQPQILIFSANGNFVISGVTNDDTGVAINSWRPNPAVGSGGGGGGGGSLSGMTAGQVPIAASDTTVTSSFPLGTGTQTALGVNVGSGGSVLVNGGALGTPSSGVATNLTGTAAGLTAGNVTTNANLTGPVTSTGNATAIANGAVALAKLGNEVDGNCVVGAAGVWTAGACGGASFANPTATVGPTATNGSASTAMRSDAAPAINLTSGYNWTGSHSIITASGVPETLGATTSTLGLDIRNGTTPQSIEVCNTWTSTTSFECGIFDWQGTANVLTLGTQKGSGGGTARNIQFLVGGTKALDYGLERGGFWAFVGGGWLVTHAAGQSPAMTARIPGNAGDNRNNLTLANTSSFDWASSNDAHSGTEDTYLGRCAAGVVCVGISAGDTSGSVLSRILPVSKTSNYTVLSADTNKHFDNTGAAGEVDFTLPAAAAGLHYCFLASAAQIVKIVATNSDKIFALTNSAANGNIQQNTLGASVCIEAHGTGQWWSTSHELTWTVT
jgi:hypothetical protein